MYNEGKEIERFKGDSPMINECIKHLIENNK